MKKRNYKAGESKGVAFEAIELEKDPKFRKWIVENIGMKWRDYVLSEEDVRHALRDQYRKEHGIPYHSSSSHSSFLCSTHCLTSARFRYPLMTGSKSRRGTKNSWFRTLMVRLFPDLLRETHPAFTIFSSSPILHSPPHP